VSWPLLGRLGGGAAAVLLGLFPVLASLGQIETEGGIEPFARVFAFLFGAVFVAIGLWLVGAPLLALARAHGAASWRDALVLGRRHLGRRANPASMSAAAGVAGLAAGYWLAAGGITFAWLGGLDWLRALVIIEFLVIHGFPFLIVAAVFARGTRGRGRIVARGALGALLLLYGAMAWKTGGGIAGLVGLLYLILPNVLGFAGAEASVSLRVLVTSRWVIKFALFMLTASVIGGGSFDGPETVWIGAVYFTLLAGMEWFRIAEVPGELATGRAGD
jgi:hypothetical protein